MSANIKPLLPKLPIRHAIYKAPQQQLAVTPLPEKQPVREARDMKTESNNEPLFADIACRDKTNKVVASFDVGIKHLAYCVLSYPAGSDKYKIYDWGIINLADDEEPAVCCHILPKTKQACGKKASHQVGTENFCGMHVKKFNSSDSLLEKSQGKPNLAVKPIKAASKQRIESISIQDLCVTMVEKLDAVPIFLQVDEILIEQQPAIGSNRFGPKTQVGGGGPGVHPRMKNLSYMIYSYFIMRGVMNGTSVKAVKFINSNNKLKLYDGPPIVATQKNPYNRNKFLAKEHMRYILRNRSKLLAFFEEYKKKDDLADCFLQGAWYLSKNQA
jgi:hypothetical protein